MMDERYLINYLSDETPDMKAIVDRCLELGLTTSQDGRTDVCSDYTVGDLLDGNDDIDGDDRQKIVDEISAVGGEITFWYGQESDTTASVSVSKSDEPEWSDHKVGLSLQTMPLDPSVDFGEGRYTREKVQKRVESITDLVGGLAEVVEPEYVYGMLLVGTKPHRGLKPTGRPISENVERLSWISVLSDPIIEDFGGRERVLDTPAWRVEELETGHVMIVKTNNPIDPTEGPSVSVDRYLLDGESEEKQKRERSDIDDPFAALGPGDIGSDIVVRQENAAGDLTNEDLELVRCEVRDRSLWEAETGEFLRRVIDESGTPIGDLPDGVDPEDEPYPTLIRLGVPVSFVRLDGPGDENVVTNVMEIDINESKLQLLANVASRVPDDPTPDDIEPIEELVGQLARLDDTDGIEDLIETHLL